MEDKILLRIVLESPTVGVDFGLQKGRGKDYKTIQVQRANGKNLLFEFNVKFKTSEDAGLVFLGPFAHGIPAERFVYIDIGTFAGQKDSPWSRRLKIPLSGITFKMIDSLLSDNGLIIETSVAGKGKGGGPNCGTVKPFNGWKLKQKA